MTSQTSRPRPARLARRPLRAVQELDQRMSVMPEALVDVSLGKAALGHAGPAGPVGEPLLDSRRQPQGVVIGHLATVPRGVTQ